MKKLMIVAAAAMGMTAFADIESVNVVGYTETALEGYKMLTPSFKNIATADYPIDNFIVKGSADVMTSIQILNEKGQTVGQYFWYNAYGDYPAGWFDFDGVEPANIELKPGQAAFFYTSETGVSVVSAGQVPGQITGSVSGYTMLGNGSPVTIPVDNMTIDGSADVMTSIQVLNEKGQTTAQYFWYNAYGDYPAGWFDFDGVEPADINLAPGESFLFFTSETGVTATIPAAIAE